MTVKIRSAYGPKKRFPTRVGSQSATKQSFKKECDINHIMAKYQKTGLVDHFNENKPQYGFVTAVDFRGSLELVRAAQDQFAGLPSSVRRRFDESPAEFLAFCEDPANREEAAVLGLLDPEVQVTPTEPSAEPPAPPHPVPDPPVPE